jgi:hypothetical protein
MSALLTIIDILAIWLGISLLFFTFFWPVS